MRLKTWHRRLADKMHCNCIICATLLAIDASVSEPPSRGSVREDMCVERAEQLNGNA